MDPEVVGPHSQRSEGPQSAFESAASPNHLVASVRCLDVAMQRAELKPLVLPITLVQTPQMWIKVHVATIVLVVPSYEDPMLVLAPAS